MADVVPLDGRAAELAASIADDSADLAAILRDALAQHDAPNFDPEFGFLAPEVGADHAIASRLVVARVFAAAYWSRSSHRFRLRDPELVRAVLTLLDAQQAYLAQQAAMPPVVPDDLFADVVGLEPVKEMLLLHLRAAEPAHFLLLGPPGSAKTLFLEAIARLPRSLYADASATTRAGVTDYLLGEPLARFLVLDDLHNMAPRDAAGLLGWMATGRVAGLTARRRADAHTDARLFAGANRRARMRPELLSRFTVEELPPYTAQEYRLTVETTLVRREGCSEEFARWVAGWATTAGCRDVRAPVRLARVSGGDLELAERVAPRMLRC